MGKCKMIGICTEMAGTDSKPQKIGSRLCVDGSYTLEAAFVFPVVLGICFAILYSIFFYHDRAMLQSNLEEILLLEAEGESLNQTEKGEYLQQRLWLFVCKDNEIKKGKLYMKGSVTATASLHIPLLQPFLEESQKISLSEKYSLIYPASYRRYRNSQ